MQHSVLRGPRLTTLLRDIDLDLIGAALPVGKDYDRCLQFDYGRDLPPDSSQFSISRVVFVSMKLSEPMPKK